jgi:hypothetical protein
MLCTLMNIFTDVIILLCYACCTFSSIRTFHFFTATFSSIGSTFDVFAANKKKWITAIIKITDWNKWRLWVFICVILLCVFMFWVPCCDVRYDFRIIKTMFGSSLSPVVCRNAHIYVILCLFAYIQWCPAHIVLCICFSCLRLVYPMLPVSLDCLFLTLPSVFTNVYLWKLR